MEKKVTLALPELSMWQATKVGFDRILSSAKLQDFNSFESPEKRKPASFKGTQVKDCNVPVTIFNFPVVVLEVK